MPPTEATAFAPAKINLTLHVTGLRADGFHLLDSYVVFADIGDNVHVARAPEMRLHVTGPLAAGVPSDDRNLCWIAARVFGEPVEIILEKNLPSAAGIGGGSSDAAAVVRAMEELFERPFAGDELALGADVPVCRIGHAAHMQGIGEQVMPLFHDPFHAVLVNPRVEVATPDVFRALDNKKNPPMTPWPEAGGTSVAYAWLRQQRNDLQLPTEVLEPKVTEVLRALGRCKGIELARMSGSGATCFGLFGNAVLSQAAAQTLAAVHPDWWVSACVLR